MRSGRQRRNEVACRNRSPWRWSYATSHHALDAQRLPRQVLAPVPAARRARASAGPPMPLPPLSTPARDGPSARSCAAARAPSTSSRRRASLNELVTPTLWSVPPSSYRPSRSDPTIVPGPFLCHRKPATTQSAVRWCLTLIISRLPGHVAQVGALGDHPVQAGALEHVEPPLGGLRVVRRRGEAGPMAAASPAAARAWPVGSAKGSVRAGRGRAVGQEVEGDVRGRAGLGQHRDPRRGGVDAQQEGVEVQLRPRRR